MIRVSRRPVLAMLVVIGLLTTACMSSTRSGSSPSAHASASPSPADVTYSLGHFPAVPTGSFAGSTTAELQAVLDAAVADEGLPGVTATVLSAGGGAWSGAAGTADGVHPVQPRSQFAIASITKTVIAAEVMWLSEKGQLRLSDPVSEHLPPSFHFSAKGVTIEDLLSMESGIPDPAASESSPSVLADLSRRWTPE